MSRKLSIRRSAWVPVVVVPLLTLGLAPTSTGSPAAAGLPSAATGPAATALWADAPASTRRIAAPRSVAGAHRLVVLRKDALPTRAAGQRLRFPIGVGTSVTGKVTDVEHTGAYTSWTGSLDLPLGTFTVVEADGVFRGEVVSPQGAFDLTRAQTHGAGDQYWLTAVAPGGGNTGDDVRADATATAPRDREPALARPTAAPRKGKISIDVLFGYTREAKQVVGGKKQVKAAAALAIADTNLAFKNSGIKAKMHLKGVVPAKGKDSDQVFTVYNRAAKPHDGNFDALLKQRSRRHADIAHLFTGGPSDKLCGAGAEPRTPREATRSLGLSVSFISCLPYLVATHEMGHNLGADHILYKGVSHDSRLPYAYGAYDVPDNFITVMGYYDPCQDRGVYTCVRIPWFSGPKKTFNGLPVGADNADNTRAIKLIAPRVARYAR